MLDTRRTLVLDSAYRPLHAVGWQRAIVRDVLDRVDVLEYYEAVVRSAHDAFPLPAVVRLRDYVQRRRRSVSLSRRNLLLRDDATCQYCGARPPTKDLTVDHVVPRSRGGPATWQNLVIACGSCNRRKGGRTPGEAGMPLLRPPRVPQGFTLDRPSSREGLPVEWESYLPA